MSQKAVDVSSCWECGWPEVKQDAEGDLQCLLQPAGAERTGVADFKLGRRLGGCASVAAAVPGG